jgi:hypothetical protein
MERVFLTGAVTVTSLGLLARILIRIEGKTRKYGQTMGLALREE